MTIDPTTEAPLFKAIQALSPDIRKQVETLALHYGAWCLRENDFDTYLFGTGVLEGQGLFGVDLVNTAKTQAAVNAAQARLIANREILS